MIPAMPMMPRRLARTVRTPKTSRIRTEGRATVGRISGTDTLRIRGGLLHAAGFAAGTRIEVRVNPNGTITLSPAA